MSHGHIRVKREPPKVNVGRGVAVRLIIGFVLFGVAVVTILLVWPANPVNVTTTGQIEQTRVSVDYIQSGGAYRGGAIYYQIEALVSYQRDGKSISQWLVASPPNRSRDMLLTRISQNPTKCLVYWTEKNPANVKCEIEDAWSNFKGLNP
jgi:hypothetical protein